MVVNNRIKCRDDINKIETNWKKNKESIKQRVGYSRKSTRFSLVSEEWFKEDAWRWRDFP